MVEKECFSENLPFRAMRTSVFGLLGILISPCFNEISRRIFLLVLKRRISLADLNLQKLDIMTALRRSIVSSSSLQLLILAIRSSCFSFSNACFLTRNVQIPIDRPVLPIPLLQPRVRLLEMSTVKLRKSISSPSTPKRMDTEHLQSLCAHSKD